MEDKLYIAYSTDNNCANLANVSLVSAIENNKDKQIEFLILHSDLTETNLQRFAYYNKYDNVTVRPIKVDETLFDGLPVSKWVTIQTWFRVAIPILNPDITKVLYLDCDTLVTNSLNDLWNIDLGDNYLAAAKDIANGKNHLKRLKMKSNAYFNAGVILINCKKFREDNVLQKIKDIVNSKKYNLKFSDQDVLNLIADEAKIVLPMKYDYMEVWWHNGYYEYYGEDEKLYLEARKNPTIVHLSGKKPNKKGCGHSQKDNWWKYAKLSNIYDELLDEYNSSTEYVKTKSIWEKIFSVYSEHKNNIKWRVFNILGIKLKIKLRNPKY